MSTPIRSDHHVERRLERTPETRRTEDAGQPFAPAQESMHGQDDHGIHASAASVQDSIP
jgi:hypothetical protein